VRSSGSCSYIDLDLEIEDHGTIWLLRPTAKEVRQQLIALTSAERWQWFGAAIACEPRYVEDLAAALARGEGL
jgi:hypothetical protein